MNLASSGDAARPLCAEEADALFAPCLEAKGLVLAVSGGPDSMALMGLVAQWAARKQIKIPLLVATVDHGLRPAAVDEARMVAQRALSLGLSHQTLHWQGDKPARGLQEAARQMRYRLLRDFAAATGASHLLTAHTLDDQAETLMMRLAAGSGLTGLSGMKAGVRRGEVLHLRPLLPVPKARLVASCEAFGWPFVTDPSNADPRFTRSRWRGLMPRLAQEGLTAARLGRLAQRLARADAALEAEAARRLGPATAAGQGLAFPAAAFRDAPEEIILRALALAVAQVQQDGPGLEHPPSLSRLEALAARVAMAAQDGAALASSIAGCTVRFAPSTGLIMARETPRRRGRPVSPAPALREAGDIHPSGAASLGNAVGDA